jgi:hypothetical protein
MVIVCHFYTFRHFQILLALALQSLHSLRVADAMPREVVACRASSIQDPDLTLALALTLMLALAFVSGLALAPAPARAPAPAAAPAPALAPTLALPQIHNRPDPGILCKKRVSGFSPTDKRWMPRLGRR